MEQLFPPGQRRDISRHQHRAQKKKNKNPCPRFILKVAAEASEQKAEAKQDLKSLELRGEFVTPSYPNLSVLGQLCGRCRNFTHNWERDTIVVMELTFKS